MNFIDFPKHQEPDVRKYMPKQYSDVCKQKYHPVVINPKDIQAILRNKKYFMACKSITGENIWITSRSDLYPFFRLREFWFDDEEHFIPSCYGQIQRWMEKITWWRLTKMSVKYTGEYIVFVDPSYKEHSIEKDQCVFIEDLQAYVMK